MKCSKCNYEWETKSKLMFVTCPSCRIKSKNTNKIEKDKEENAI